MVGSTCSSGANCGAGGGVGPDWFLAATGQAQSTNATQRRRVPGPGEFLQSKHTGDENGGGLVHPVEQRATLKALQRDFFSILQILEEDFVHLPSDALVQDHQRRLVVEDQRSVIEVD